MSRLISDNEDLDCLLSAQKELVSLVLEKKDHSDSEELILRCADYAKKLGLHYGHSSCVKRCHSYHLCGIANSVSVIDMIKTYRTLMQSALIIRDSVLRRENIFVCGIKGNNISNAQNINCVFYPKWIPGTLTNRKFVGSSYGTDKLFNINLVISMNVRAYNIISREIKVNDRRNVKLISIADTNVYADLSTNSLKNVMFNDESYYCNVVFSSFMDFCFEKSSAILKK